MPNCQPNSRVFPRPFYISETPEPVEQGGDEGAEQFGTAGGWKEGGWRGKGKNQNGFIENVL